MTTKPVELKFFDNAFGPTNPTGTGVIETPFVGIPQGLGEQARVGAKVSVKKFKIYASIEGVKQVGAGPLPDLMRIIVLVDTQANGANPAVTDVLATATFNSFQNMHNLDRFVLLKDSTVQVDITAASVAAGSIPQGKRWQFKWDMKNLPIYFNGATGAITEFTSNNLCVLLMNRNSQSTYAFRSRVTFTDA